MGCGPVYISSDYALPVDARTNYQSPANEMIKEILESYLDEEKREL